MGVHDEGHEPDPRYSLANERTFLAWVRTVLAVLAGAVALHALEVPAQQWPRRLLVAALFVLGGSTMALAYRRWQLVERAMRTGRALPRFGLGAVVTAAVLLATVLLAITLTVG